VNFIAASEEGDIAQRAVMTGLLAAEAAIINEEIAGEAYYF
jgi:hypothetical protein